MITFGDNISVEHYNELRESVGWNAIKPHRAEIGLSNSVCFIAEDEGKAIGMARLITDGGYVSCIFDVIVHPEYQKRGIGTQLLKNVMDYIWEHLEEDETQVICLFAKKGKENFYSKFGFEERPNEISGAGMSQRIKKVSNLI